ncbi:Sporulation-specific protein 22 [Spathaspora sp. JA1]|nr:Sporulation-specific protein 22 [Spathaspora sp. JA1]
MNIVIVIIMTLSYVLGNNLPSTRKFFQSRQFVIRKPTNILEYIISQQDLVPTNITNPDESIPQLDTPPRDALSIIDEIEAEIPSLCRQNTFDIHTRQDLDNIIECEILVGDIVISEYNYPIIIFPKLGKILGNLTIIKSPELVRIEAPNLQIISSKFVLTELTSLSLISFPLIKFVNVLDWNILPILSNVHFNNEIQGIESIRMSDTSLTGFSGFLTDTLETLDINNNRFLDIIESNVEKIHGKLHIAANANDVKVNLPRLTRVNNLSINNVETLNLHELKTVDNSLSLSNNYFQQIRFPQLKEIGGTLSIYKNENVNHIEFQNLEEISGGLMLNNNSKIDKVNFFPKLKIIGGALELIGSIKEISFKQLKLIKGSAIVKSTSIQFDCNKWLSSSTSEILLVVRGGKIECTNYNNEKFTSKVGRFEDEVSRNANHTISTVKPTFKKTSLGLRIKPINWLTILSILL